MTKKLFENKYDCCGCSACYSVCPKGAVIMKTDEEGFLYPFVNADTCINCGKCEDVCPIKRPIDKNEPHFIFAAKNRDEEIREKSSSGGMFSLLARFVEMKNGVIYGAAFNERFEVCHKRAESVDEWKAFCVSKYVQSDIGDTFKQACEDLICGKTVLFSGTPCQIAGLQNCAEVLKIDTSKLITCDIVCHGTPSPGVWKSYLLYIQKKERRKIGAISFRDKTFRGWHNSTITIKDDDGNIILSEGQETNFFFNLFLGHEILRESCSYCKYANFHRPGDITLGDYWGIEREFSHFDDDKGVSLVIVNTEKGEKMWNEIVVFTECFEVTKEQCTQPNLQKASEMSWNRETFWKWYTRFGLVPAGKRLGYLPMNKFDVFLLFCYRCFKKICSVFRR